MGQFITWQAISHRPLPADYCEIASEKLFYSRLSPLTGFGTHGPERSGRRVPIIV
jgi:hypothetical protein